MSREKICEHCAYFLANERTDGSAGGVCRRYPPIPMLLQQPGNIMQPSTVGMAGVSPPVSPDYTCGEFQDAKVLSLVGDTTPAA